MQEHAPAVLDPNEAPEGFVAVLKSNVATYSLGNICRACDWRSECNEANLATPFQAVAQVMRGGVKRRDVIKVTPSFNDGGTQSVKM